VHVPPFRYALVDLLKAVTGRVTLAVIAESVDPEIGVHWVIKQDIL